MIPDPVLIQSQKKLSSLSQLPASTSSFNPIHRRNLNIIFENAIDSTELIKSYEEDLNFDSSLLIQNLTRIELITIDEQTDLFDKLNNDEKTFALLLNKVLLHDPLKISIRESFTSNFLNYLLNKIEFNKYPLILNLQPKYSFEVEGNKISGKPEFSVEKQDQIRVLFLDESRHLNNIRLATEFSECQIGAELISSAFTNYAFPLSSTMLQDQVIYVVRIIGTRFTFYKAQVYKAYLDALIEGNLNDSTVVTIHRYPPSDDKQTLFGYDYSNQNHRILILNLLTRLREEVKRN